MTDRPALTEPAGALASFPTAVLPTGRRVARSHSAERSPWWFASAPPAGGGRFDLVAPRGTCYVADTVETAVRERLRQTLSASGVVTTRMADSFAVSLFAAPRAFTCAHIGVARAARFGVTRELESLTPGNYVLSRAWASALCDAGFEGVRYGARFTPGPANAWALFGSAGDRERPLPVIDCTLSGRDACHRTGIRVLPVPRLCDLSIIGPDHVD